MAAAQGFVAASRPTQSLSGMGARRFAPQSPLKAPCRRHGLRSRTNARRRAAIRAAYVSPATQAPPGSQKELRLELPTADFQRSVEFTSLRRGRGGTAILVQEVAPGSAAAAAGVRPGQQLLAVSDPIRQNETWELSNGLTSLKYVRQTVDARAGESITVRLTAEPVSEWQQALAAARTALGSSSSSDSEDERLTEAEKAELLVQLEALDKSAAARKLASRVEKLEQRRAYEQDNVEQKRSSTPFFLAFVVLFLLVPAGFIVAALSTGYVGLN